MTRRNDKKSAMREANKKFQERMNAQSLYAEEKVVKYTIVPDLYPQLSKMLK